MRRRAITIYAENKDDFMNIMKSQDEREKDPEESGDKSNVKRTKGRRRSRVSLMTEKLEERLANQSFNEEEIEYDFLSLREDFQMVKKEPTLQEMEKIEEENLVTKIENMNKFYKNKNTDEFLSAVSDLSYLGDKREHSANNTINDTPFKKQAVDVIFDQKVNNHSMVSSNSTNFSSSTNSISNSNKNLNIIMQNLVLSDELLKFIVIGDKAVGKSYMIDKLMGEETESNSEYKPTQSLEIKRFLYRISKSTVKIELLDTNISILCSEIVKTYYKIVNGFILLCDITCFESIKFVEKQVENILNFSKSEPNLLLFVNIKDEVNTEDYFQSLEYLSQLDEKYSLKANFVNLSEYSISKDMKFQKFLITCLCKEGRTFNTNNLPMPVQSNPYTLIQNNTPTKHTKSNSSLISPTKKDKCLIF